MQDNPDIFKFPPISDKLSDGVLTKTQWLHHYYTYREHSDAKEYAGMTPQQYQSALGQNNSLLANRYRGALLGLAAGDALGTTLEFEQRPSTNLVTDIVGGGPFNLKCGQWTDDTSMALCLAHSLITKRCFDPQDQMELYVSWYKDGAFSSTGRCFDIGNTTASALRKFSDTGVSFAGAEDPRSAGNGSLMRLVPVVLFYASEPDDAIDYAAESSKTTHAATEAVDACRLFAALILGALYGERKETILSPEYTPAPNYWVRKPLTDTIKQIWQGSYKNKSRKEIKSTGYVVDSLEAALWAFHNSDGFEEGAIMAVNLGGDADTIGAIYGQLAGAYYGETGIPFHWIKKLAYNHIFYLFADDLVSYYSGKPVFE